LEIWIFCRTFVTEKENNRKTPNKMEQLNHRICIYIPSTFDGNKPAKRMQKKATRKAAQRLSTYFGGATTTQAVGYWNSPEKGLIAEKQILVYSACNESDKAKYTDAVTNFAKAVCRWMKQEAVTVEIDGTLQFVEA
jgi:hypothetical protein